MPYNTNGKRAVPDGNAPTPCRKPKKKRMECSKKILMLAAVTNSVVIIFTMVMVVITRDVSPLAYLIPSVGAEVATGTAFYYNKAREENRIKLMKRNDIKPEAENFSSIMQ